MWDITYLNGHIKGQFYYLYLFSDLYSRDIVGWEAWETEDAEHASELIKRTCLKQRRLSTTPLVLHSDNGSPMKGATMLDSVDWALLHPTAVRESATIMRMLRASSKH